MVGHVVVPLHAVVFLFKKSLCVVEGGGWARELGCFEFAAPEGN